MLCLKEKYIHSVVLFCINFEFVMDNFKNQILVSMSTWHNELGFVRM